MSTYDLLHNYLVVIELGMVACVTGTKLQQILFSSKLPRKKRRYSMIIALWVHPNTAFKCEQTNKKKKNRKEKEKTEEKTKIKQNQINKGNPNEPR